MIFRPLNKDTLPHIEALFGPGGACGGCWCTYLRQSNQQYEKYKGEGNHQKLQELVRNAQPMGVLAFQDQQAVGWCAVSPRSDLPRVENSRIMAVGSPQAWIIHCLFIAKTFRRAGLSASLIREAYKYALTHGAKIVEAYPLESNKNTSDTFAWHGFLKSFEQAGFVKVEKRSKIRWMVSKHSA